MFYIDQNPISNSLWLWPKKTGEKIFKPAAECVVYEHNKPKNDMRVDG